MKHKKPMEHIELKPLPLKRSNNIYYELSSNLNQLSYSNLIISNINWNVKGTKSETKGNMRRITEFKRQKTF